MRPVLCRLIFASLAVFCALGFLAPAPVAAVVMIDLVPVGNSGNGDDPSDGDLATSGVQNFGSVDYAYSIGKY